MHRGKNNCSRPADRRADDERLGVALDAINAKMQRFLNLIDEFATYLKLNEGSMVDYCRRYWKGQPVSSSRAESMINLLVNAR